MARRFLDITSQLGVYTYNSGSPYVNCSGLASTGSRTFQTAVTVESVVALDIFTILVYIDESNLSIWDVSWDSINEYLIQENEIYTTGSLVDGSTVVVSAVVSADAMDEILARLVALEGINATEKVNTFLEEVTISSPIDPSTFTWARESIWRGIDIVAPKLALFNHNLDMDLGYTYNNLATRNVAVSFATGSMVISRSLLNSLGTVIAPIKLSTNHCAVEATITACSTTGTYSIPLVGITKDTNCADLLMVEYDRVASVFRLVEVNSGTWNTIASVSSVTLTPPYTIGLSLHGNDVAGWLKTGNGWRLMCYGTSNSALRDFTDPAVLAEHSPMVGYSTSSTAGNSVTFSKLTYGPFGQCGLRDPHLITKQDLSPLYIDNKVYFSATCAAPSGKSSAGIYTFDTNTNQIEKTAQFLTIDGDGVIDSRLPINIIFDDNVGKFRLFASDWGYASGVTIAQASTTKWILDGLHIITDYVDMTLPTGSAGEGVYDAAVYYDAGDGLWYCGYTINDDITFVTEVFHAAVATSTDLSTWTLIDEDSTRMAAEGTKFSIIGGEKYLIQAARTVHYIYEKDLTYVGSVATPLTTTAPGSPPHAMIIPIPSGGVTKFKMLQFDATKMLNSTALFSWGNIHIMVAAESQTGNDVSPQQFVPYYPGI